MIDAQDHGFMYHLKEVFGGLKGQLAFKFDIYSIKYMYPDIISPDVVEKPRHLRSSSSSYIEHRD